MPHRLWEVGRHMGAEDGGEDVEQPRGAPLCPALGGGARKAGGHRSGGGGKEEKK